MSWLIALNSNVYHSVVWCGFSARMSTKQTSNQLNQSYNQKPVFYHQHLPIFFIDHYALVLFKEIIKYIYIYTNILKVKNIFIFIFSFKAMNLIKEKLKILITLATAATLGLLRQMPLMMLIKTVLSKPCWYLN